MSAFAIVAGALHRSPETRTSKAGRLEIFLGFFCCVRAVGMVIACALLGVPIPRKLCCMRDFMTVIELAEIARLSPSFIRKAIGRGQLRAVQFWGCAPDTSRCSG
jgi:hypothetical protein